MHIFSYIFHVQDVLFRWNTNEPSHLFQVISYSRMEKWEPVVLCFSVEGAVNKKCLFIIVKRGILDNFSTPVHTDYICKTQYIAQIGNPFIHFVIQYIFCNWTLANSLSCCPPCLQIVFAQPPGHMTRGSQHVAVGLHSVTQHFRPSLQVLVSFLHFI